MMNIYLGDKHSVENMQVTKVFDFAKPILHKDILSKKDLVRKYGKHHTFYYLTYKIEDADFCVLPYSWNYYYDNNKIKEALSFINNCKEAGKEVVTVNLGDFGVKVPVEDVIVIRQSGYQSKRLLKQFGMSVFFTDPLNVFFNDNLKLREKGEKPVVGFCGQGKMPGYKYVASTGLTLYRNIKYYTGLSNNEPQVLYPSTLRRNIILGILEKSKKVTTDFLIREKYRGGAKGPEEMLKTTMEFYNNIINSDYTVSIRGGGNFSVRIYETLAMGRIPLFINTDSVLPFDKHINWKDHVVWVEENEMKYSDEKLADFHNEIHPDDFKQLQLNNRKLWLEYLSFGGFYYHLKDIIEDCSNLSNNKSQGIQL